ncbi:hypothetical protein DYB32_006784 [Aphanomyces invadans]|uniref:Uncharacterized protein n=1 Tax=Aphanomyces invadans TaxID=157072 RepID=A0A3R6VUE9_9STRA|nr:hypothetical protein DYB32_006784 [Aphanomyces invadans]
MQFGGFHTESIRSTILASSFKVDSKAVTSALPEVTTCLSQGFTEAEWNALTKVPNFQCENHPVCTRRCGYSVSLKEWYTKYTCASDVSKYPVQVGYDRKTCVGDESEMCRFTHELKLQATSLATASISLKTENPVYIEDPQSVFPGKGLDKADKTLYFDAKCDSHDLKFDTFCDFEVDLNKVFKFSSELGTHESVVGLLKGYKNEFKAAASDVVFWRAKVNGGNWVQITKDKAALPFRQYNSKLYIEAFTNCGTILEEMWTIFVHRHEILSADQWFRTLWTSPTPGCNEQDSDFGVIQFKHDPTSEPFQSMLHPDIHTVPNDKNGHPLKRCYVKNGHGDAKKCSGGCWWWYTECDTAISKQECSDRRAEGDILYEYCDKEHGDNADGDDDGSESDSEPDLDAAAFMALDDVEHRIQWKFKGFDCTWQYDNTKESTSWIKTSSDERLEVAIAVKLENAPTTTATAQCKLTFQSNAPGAAVTTRHRKQVVTLRNCDYPRFNQDSVYGYGQYIKDTCTNTWNDFGGKTAPLVQAPFQACGGTLVYSTTVEGAAKTVVLEPEADLSCCNSPDEKSKVTCTALKSDKSIKRCEGPAAGSPSVLALMASSEPIATSSVAMLAVVGGVMVAVAVAATKRQAMMAEGVDVDEGYQALLL